MESLMTGNVSLTSADNYEDNEDKDNDPEDLGNWFSLIKQNLQLNVSLTVESMTLYIIVNWPQF